MLCIDHLDARRPDRGKGGGRLGGVGDQGMYGGDRHNVGQRRMADLGVIGEHYGSPGRGSHHLQDASIEMAHYGGSMFGTDPVHAHEHQIDM